MEREEEAPMIKGEVYLIKSRSHGWFSDIEGSVRAKAKACRSFKKEKGGVISKSAQGGRSFVKNEWGEGMLEVQT